MGTHWLVHSTPHRAGPAAALGLACAFALLSLPAWTEELELVPEFDAGASIQSSEATFAPIPALGVAAAPLEHAALDDPWRATEPGAPTTLALGDPPCSPWNSATECNSDVALLADPWSTEAPPPPEPARQAEEQPAPPSAESEAPLEPAATDAQAKPVQPFDWTDLYGEPTHLPTSAELWATQTIASPSARSTTDGLPGSLDTWVVDLGVPDVPFD